MNILHIGPIKTRIEASGPTQSICGLAEAQSRLGLNVNLLSTWPYPPHAKMDVYDNMGFFAPFHKRPLNPWHTSSKWLEIIKNHFGRPDIISFHGVYNPFHCALSRRFDQAGWPYILVAHGCMTVLAQHYKRCKKQTANLLWFNHHVKNAIAVRALCPREAEEIGSLFKVKKIIVVPNGIEDIFFQYSQQPSAAIAEKAEPALILGFIGRIAIYHKGLDLLLAALEKVNTDKQHPKCKLFLTGPFNTQKDESEMNRMIDTYGLKNAVAITGPKYGEDKIRQFLFCDVFVHTSRHEGMPMSVVEAMALGRPCLATPGTNMAEIVSEGGGWICDPEPDSIGKAINNIIADRNSLAQRGLQAKHLIQRDFTWDSVAQKMLHEEKQLLGLA